MDAGTRTELKHSNNNNTLYSQLVRFLCASFFAIYLVFILFIPSNSYADPESKSILIISQKEKSFSLSLIKLIKNKLKEENLNIDIKNQPNDKAITEDIVKPYDLIVTLGSKPAEKVLKHKLKKPALSLLITNRALDSLNKIKSNDQPWATLLLNQPIERQLLLIKHMLGENKTISTILGPYSSKFKNELVTTSANNNLKFEYETTQISDQLISSLKNLTSKSDALLAIPDPVTFNKKTIRGILLLTYRKNIPVIGFSKSYVKAGAAASIYSSPEQISQNAVELIVDFFKNGMRFSKPIYQPKHFSVAINNRVIQTLDLGIKVKDKETLVKLIKQDEGKK